MTDPYRTAHWSLPLLAAAQAQKELTHNEALVLIDLALAGRVHGVASTPPGDPQPGDAWLIGAPSTGEWAGLDGHVAGWTAGGWRYLAPRSGWSVWDASIAARRYWTENGWTTAAVIAAPSGGGTIDAEARTAIAALIATLTTAGLSRT